MIDEIKPFVDAGFAVHWLHPKQKRPIGDDWQTKPVASFDDLRATYRRGNNVGVRLGEPSGVAGGYLHAFDLDIRKPDLADEAWAGFARILPSVSPDDLPCAQSGSGGESRHLYFVTDKPFFGKKLLVSEGKHRRWDATLKKEVWSYDWEIELFGTGKQVAMPPSIHPDSGKPYVWVREPDFVAIELGLAPTIPSDVIEALGVAETQAYEFESRDPLTFEDGQLERELALIPVSRLDDYHDWITLGQALHHQMGGSDEGFELWLEHSARSEKFDGNRRTMLRKWRGFGKRRRQPTTMATVRAWVLPIIQEQRDQDLMDQFSEIDDEDEYDALFGEDTVTEADAADGDDETDTEKVPVWVEKLNRKHSVAFVEGKTVILTEKRGGDVSYGSVADLHAYYENVRRATEKATEPVTKAWMRHPARKSYPNGIVFAPQGGPRGAYNHWKGFDVEPDAGKSCALFLAHLKDIVCAGDMVAYNWIIRWFAHMIQRPWEKPGTALVFKGQKGTGKDTVGDYIGGLFKRHHAKISNAEHLYGKFNAHQEKLLLMQVEEGFWAGDKKSEGLLKYVITSDRVQIEPKGLNAFQVDSVLRIIITSNEKWVVPASFEERRFCVVNVSNAVIQNDAYFEALRQEMKNGGRAALLHHLQNVDLRGFNVRKPPMTAGLRDQKLESLKGFEKWWHEVLTEGVLPGAPVSGGFDEDDGPGDWSEAVECPKAALVDAYNKWVAARRYAGSSMNSTEFGHRINVTVPGVRVRRPRDKDSGKPGKRFYCIPSLQECREMFEQVLGFGVEWDD